MGGLGEARCQGWHGMIANLKGQGLGVAHAAPRPGSGPSSARGAPASPSASDAARSSTENAVFDANGDGAIENWGFLHGGDSYTTFTPPPTGADPTRGRKVEAPAESAPAKTPVAIRHAHAAYRRDGSPVHDNTPGAARAAAPARMTNPPAAQPPPAPPLRSAG